MTILNFRTMLNFKNSLGYISTFATEFIVLAAGIAVYKLAAIQFGEAAFAEYALCRRTLSLFLPLIVFGMGVAIPRYVAFTSQTQNFNKRVSYFLGGLLLVMGVTVPVLILINIFSDMISFLIFGNAGYSHLIPYVSSMILGSALHAVCYGFYRGGLNVKMANTLQLVNMGIITLIAFSIASSLKGVLLFTGIAWSAISLIAIFTILKSYRWNGTDIISCIRELFVYGVQRFPGDVLLAGYFALPAYFTAHLVHDELITAGYIAFSMSLLTMAGAAFGPVCLLLLPKASKVIASRDFDSLKKYTSVILFWTIAITSFGLAIFEFFAEKLLSFIVKDINSSLTQSVRIITFGSIGYTIYISLRSILDAYYIKAINTRNILISFAFFLLGSITSIIGKDNYLNILYSFVFSLSLLGLLTVRETNKVIRKEKLN